MESLKFVKYNLTPLKRANRFEMKQRSGLLIRFEINGKVGYSDYFAWEELGDLAVDYVLKDLLSNSRTNQINLLVQQAKEFSSIDFEKLCNFTFKNHLLFNTLNTYEKCVKMKVGVDLDAEILTVKALIKNRNILRLDFNSALDVSSLKSFWNKLTDFEKSKIEYIEDPIPYEANLWKELQSSEIPLALDRVIDFSIVDYNSFDFLVFKPNIYELKYATNLKKPIILSSYMGHDVGRIYCTEVCRRIGEKDFFHGLDTPNLYREQMKLFNISNNKYNLNIKNVVKLLHELEGLPWQLVYQMN